MTHNHVCDILGEEFSKNGFPGLIFKYWGHDPDDLEMGTDEDGLTGIYDAFMIPDERLDEFRHLCHRLNAQFEKMIGFHVTIIKHGVLATKQYYPEITGKP